jgi:hypothetical protein
VRSIPGGVGATAFTLLLLTTTACSDAADTEPVAASTPTTVAPPAGTTRPSCETALPVTWRGAIDGSGVNTGGVANTPLAVDSSGEVAVARDNGTTRDLLLIGADKSVKQIYAVPDPDKNRIGSLAIDDRWIVVGLNRAPRNANGVLPTLYRIDVIDRQDNSVRTVVEGSDDEYAKGGQTLDSVALFGGKVYWITRDKYSDEAGKVSSYNLGAGTVEDTGMTGSELRTTAAGLTWVVQRPNAEVKIPASLPPAVAEAVGTGQDLVTLTTDGTAYAWATGVDNGGNGVAWWSPDVGLVRVTGNLGMGKDQPAPLYVAGPFVLLDKGRGDNKGDTFATVVDTRSGALTYLPNPVGGANNGTIAVGLGPQLIKQEPASAGVVRTAALPALTC